MVMVNTSFNNTIWGYPTFFEQEVAQLFVFSVIGILQGIVTLIGIIGNFLIIHILSKKRKSSLNVILIGLAVFDFIVCTVKSLGASLSFWLWRYKVGAWYFHLFCGSIVKSILGDFGKTNANYKLSFFIQK